MKKRISWLLTAAMLISLLSAGLPAWAADTSDLYTLDFSFPLEERGADLRLGVEGMFSARLQTFTPVTASHLLSVDFIVLKTTGNALLPFPDMEVRLYEAEQDTGKPLAIDSPLATVTIPGGAVNDGTPTTAVFNYEGLERGLRYAVLLTPTPSQPNDVEYNTYYAIRRDTATSPSEFAGRIDIKNTSEVNIAATYHLWMKVNLEKIAFAGATVDYSHENPSTGGLGLGHTGEAARYQTFTATQTGVLKEIDVILNKRYESLPYGGQISDLIVSVYRTADGKPAGNPIKTVTVPAGDLAFAVPPTGDRAVGGLFTIELDCAGLVEGERYAVALSQENIAPDGLVGEHYRWPSRKDVAPEEFSGKLYNGNWINETVNTGTMWIVIRQTNENVELAPRRVVLGTSVFEYLQPGETFQTTAEVYNQYNELMVDYPVVWSSENPSIAAVDAQTGLITCLAPGRTKIRASAVADKVFAQVWLETYVGLANKITGSPFISLAAGQSQDLDYEVMNDYRFVIDGLAKDIAYVVADPSVAEVADGKITGLRAGQTELTVTYTGGYERTPIDGLAKKVNVNVTGPEEGLVEPAAGMVITQDVKFKPGTYYLDGGISIASSHITVDGNGATLINTPAVKYVVPTGDYMFFSGTPGDEDTRYMRTAQKIDLTGAASAQLSYDILAEVEEGWDIFAVQISEDGVNYTSLATPNNYDATYPGWAGESAYAGFAQLLPSYWGKMDSFVSESIDISAYAGKQVYLLFVLKTDWATTYNGVYLDNIKVTADGAAVFEDGAENGMANWAHIGFAQAQEGGAADYSGVGIDAQNVSGVTLKNISVKGYNTGAVVRNGQNWVIEYCDFSDNYHNPAWGWGDGESNNGGLRIEYLNNSIIRYNNANRVWNNLHMKFSNKNQIYGNDFGDSSNVSIKMWTVSFNEIYGNIMNWGFRLHPGEVHANDSTSLLMEGTSIYNYIARNDFSHGGDGIFLRPLYGSPEFGNYFYRNDASWANNNAVESWAPGNVYVENIANYSSYGFWLGGSDFTYLIGNQANFNGGYGGLGKTQAGELYFGNAGVSVVNGPSSNFLMMGNEVRFNVGPSLAIGKGNDSPNNDAYHWLIQNNVMTDNINNTATGRPAYGIHAYHAYWVDIVSNVIDNEGADIFERGYTRDINMIGDNNALSALKMPKADLAVDGGILFDYADAVIDDIPQQIKDAPFGIFKINNISVVAGQEVVFDASGSTDPQGLPLTCRWEFGDGETSGSATVSKTYTTPGVYRLGLTVLNGELGDMQGAVVTVLPKGAEIAADADLSAWSMQKTQGWGTPSLTEDDVRRVSGDKSLRAYMTEAGVSLAYDLAQETDPVNWADYEKFSFFLHADIEYNVGKYPVVRLYQDANNYFAFTPKIDYLSPITVGDIVKGTNTNSEARYAYQYIELLLGGSNANFTRTVAGHPDLSKITSIQFSFPQYFNYNVGLDGMILSGLIEKPAQITSVSYADAITYLVSGYAAHVPVTVTSENTQDKAIAVVMKDAGGHVLSGPVLTADGKASLKIPKLDLNGVYQITAYVVGEEDIAASTGITYVTPADNLWTPAVLDNLDGTITVAFGADLALNASKAGVTLNGAGVPFVLDGRSLIVTGSLTEEDDTLVLKGIRYPQLFPSYSFTFTLKT